MDDVALANYIVGSHFGHVEAGRVDASCAALIGVPAGTEIWFSDYTLLKLQDKHGDINYSHYKHMPCLLLFGFLARGRASNLVELWWVDQEMQPPEAYFAVLKATKSREVFVGTFHRVSIKEARRLRKKATIEGRLIRSQPDVDALLAVKK